MCSRSSLVPAVLDLRLRMNHSLKRMKNLRDRWKEAMIAPKEEGRDAQKATSSKISIENMRAIVNKIEDKNTKKPVMNIILAMSLSRVA
mmetsp:Transcript_28428/g.40222  ORF Transcript_28428/g.40222 Transcript_28428/m.40222 type:complete len:89 (-) Transcript_28428:569-835(-)